MKLKVVQAPVQVGFEFEFGGNCTDETLKKLFKKYMKTELKAYRNGFKAWCLTNDHTYNGECEGEYEIVSPVMEFDESIKILKKFLKMMRDTRQKTDEMSGLHINMSFKHKRLHKKIRNNLVELWLNVPEKDILKKFNREHNDYCTPIGLNLINKYNDPDNWYNNYYEKLEINVEKFNTYIFQNMGHSSSIDFSRIKQNGNGSRIEFRMTGGRNYPNKLNDIIKVMRKYRMAMLKSINEKPSTTQTKLFKFIKDNYIPYYKYNNKHFCGIKENSYW